MSRMGQDRSYPELTLPAFVGSYTLTPTITPIFSPSPSPIVTPFGYRDSFYTATPSPTLTATGTHTAVFSPTPSATITVTLSPTATFTPFSTSFWELCTYPVICARCEDGSICVISTVVP